MIDEPKTRKCVKCKQEKPEHAFQRTPSRFIPGHRSLICTSCLETMVKQSDFDEVDALMRHLDLPFDLNKWTQLYETHRDHTLSAYFNLLADEHYKNVSWADENRRWLLAREEQTIDDEIKAISTAKLARLQKVWSAAYNTADLLWLDNFYNQIVATQNVSTPILQEKARDFCEIQLHIKQGLREGVDVKKLMDAADNIVKTYNFTASNAKSAADFESVGELMVYYGKKGWHPNWHNEPKDSIDFLMQDIQTYLKRLVHNEGSFIEQVDDRRERYNMTERLENLEDELLSVEDDGFNVEYEDEDALINDLNGNE